jgi:hypothetical protein
MIWELILQFHFSLSRAGFLGILGRASFVLEDLKIDGYPDIDSLLLLNAEHLKFSTLMCCTFA